MGIYPFAFGLIKDEATKAQSDPELIETTSTPDNVLLDPMSILNPRTIFLMEDSSRGSLLWFDERTRLTAPSIKACEFVALIETVSAPDNIFLDPVSIARPGIILIGADAGGEPPPITGENQDMFGYI
jgi:hypothetical protein